MDDNTRKEIVRELELDYEKTTKAIESVVSSSFTIRGWGMTLIAALIGLSFQNKLWPLSALAVVVILLLALVDGYHSWLYAKVLQHANNIETILRYYYAFLARGDVDPQAKRARAWSSSCSTARSWRALSPPASSFTLPQRKPPLLPRILIAPRSLPAPTSTSANRNRYDRY